MSRVARNLVFLLVSQLATWTITSIVLVTVPDRLSPEGWGTFGFATTYVQFFTLAASLGTVVLLTKLVARDPSTLGELGYNALVLRIISAIVLSAAAIALAVLIGTTGDALVLVALGCVGMLFLVVNDVFVGAQAGLEVMGRAAMWSVVQTYLASVIGLVVVFQGGGVVPFGAAFFLAPVVPMIANGFKVWPWLRASRRIDLGIWRMLVTAGIPLTLLTSLNLIYGTIDIPILNGIAGETTVGWYTLAYRYVAIPIFIATAAVAAFFPSFSAHGATMSDEFSRQVNRALRLVLLVSIPAAAGIAVMAEDIVGFFHTESFQPAVPVMQLLALHIPLAAVGVILGMSLIASDRHSRYILVALGAAIISPIAAVSMINWSVDQYDNGAIGAAITTVAVEVFVMVGALALRAPGVFDRRTIVFTGRILVAGGAMALVVWVLDPGLLVGILVGIVSYAVAVVAVRAIRVGEIRGGLQGVVATLRSRGAPPPDVTDSLGPGV